MNLVQEILNAVPDADPEQVMLILPHIGKILADETEMVSFTLNPLERQVFVAAEKIRNLCGSGGL